MHYVYDQRVKEYSMKNFMLDEIRIYIKKVQLYGKKWPRLLDPVCDNNDVFKLPGMVLSSRQKRMPLWLKKALSKKKNP
ncbi:MAG: hypothetical protein WED07_05985 [Candidatus Freyarchaeum deiterrae]